MSNLVLSKELSVKTVFQICCTGLVRQGAELVLSRYVIAQ